VYAALVRRRVTGVFDALSRGDWRSTMADVAPDVHHVFPGDHPLGGERHDRASVERWFERLDRLFPHHAFTVHRIAVLGGPWSTWVAVRWTGHVRPAVGEPYTNEGTHWLHISWGKVRAIHALFDTQTVACVCARMAAAGVEEASAPPIVS
jgi:ketosteroid isomerase-like protein